MIPLLLSPFALLDARANDCPDTEESVERAIETLQLLNLVGAREHLARADVGLTCDSPIEPEGLGRLWFARGVLAGLEGDVDTAARSFRAARRELDPADATPDLSPYGATIQQIWTDNPPVEDGHANLSVSPALEQGWEVRLDGELVSLPAEVTPGLHAVQIHDARGPGWFARMVDIAPGDQLVVEHALPDTPPEPPREPVAVEGWLIASAGLQTGIGNEYETAIDGEPLIEPLVKVVVPLQFGLHTDVGRGWGRVTAHVAPMLNGRFVYAGAQVPGSSMWAFGVDVGGGAQLGPVDVGLLIGARLPSRLQVRALAAIELSDSWGLEPTVGLAFPTERTPEPTIGVDLRYRFAL